MTDDFQSEVADLGTALVGVLDERLANLGNLAALSELAKLGNLAALQDISALVGPEGPVGPEGIQGPIGETGPEGRTGPKGPHGPEGPTGKDGADGAPGKVGPRGPIGANGERGPQGWKGDAGPKGDKGEKGAKGDSGPAGGGGGWSGGGMVIDDEGVALNGGADVTEIDYVGAGVSVALVGSKAVVTIPGGGGGGSDDQTAAEVPFTPAGSIAATNVQAAIEEVAAEAAGLPDWWTVDSTPDAEVVTFNGRVVLAPNDEQALTNGLITIKAPVGSAANDTDLVRILDENDSIRGVVTANGGFQFGESGDGTDGYRFLAATGDVVEVGGSGANLIMFKLGLTSTFSLRKNNNDPLVEANADGEIGFHGATPVVQQTVADIADPTIATPETNALKINELLTALRAYGLLA